jgi:hypothetical protein
MDLPGSVKGTATGFCEHGNETSVSIRCWEFIEWLSGWWCSGRARFLVVGYYVVSGTVDGKLCRYKILVITLPTKEHAQWSQIYDGVCVYYMQTSSRQLSLLPSVRFLLPFCIHTPMIRDNSTVCTGVPNDRSFV